MNYDSLDQVWQNQPVPPAAQYRDICERSWMLGQKVDHLDVRPAMVVAGGGWMLIGGIGLLTEKVDLFHLLFLAMGLSILCWAVLFWRQRRQLQLSAGDDLLRELELGLLRLQQNMTLNRLLSWIVPPLLVAVGAWIFWPHKHAYRALTMNDWVWSGSFMAMWTVFAVWSAWSGRKRRRNMDELCASLTELRAALLQLGRSDSDAAN